MRRDAVQRAGLFDVRMIRGQDHEYYYRWVESGLKVWYEPAALAYHKIGLDRLTLQQFRQWRHRQGYYGAYLIPWRKYHVATVMPLRWYREMIGLTGSWLTGILTRRPWAERFRYELKLREHVSTWLHRLALWPRWCLTVVTGRPYLL